MLHDLKQIKWDSLKTCHGSATEVPNRIVALTSSDAEIRTQALSRLGDNLEHQGDICEVTSYVVPFLIELVSSDQTQEKANILNLLETVASRWVKNRALEQIDYSNNSSSLFEQRTYEAVREGISIYLSLLQSEGAEIRQEAARILSLFRDNVNNTVPKLLQQVQAENDRVTKATIIWYLGKLVADNWSLLGDQLQLIQTLNTIIDSPQDKLLSYSAAITLFRLQKSEIPDKAINLVIDAIAYPQLYPTNFGDNVVAWTACDVLCNLSLKRGIPAFGKALAVVSNSDDARYLVDALLGFAIEGKKFHDWSFLFSVGTGDNGEQIYRVGKTTVPVHTLTPYQQEALSAILQCEQFWKTPSNLLELYGLPSSAQELKVLLDTSDPSSS
ncbi:MAG: hypothetical protein ABI947_06180 [Chloroflexota bacterium]